MDEYLCPRCGQLGPRAGKDAQCIPCRRKRQRERYYADNGRAKRAAFRQRLRATPERRAEYLRVRRAEHRRRRQGRVRRAGSVYFIQDTERGLIKIGFTGKPVEGTKGRLKELQCGNPHLLVCLATIPGDRMTEALLHERFWSERHRNEWFRPAPALLDFIAGLSAPQLAQAV